MRKHQVRSPAQLRSLPWRALVDGDAVDSAVETGSSAKPPLFRPVVDGWVIPGGYEQTYANGLQNDVTYIAGNNLDESGAVPEAAFADTRAAGSKARRPGMPPVHVTLDDYLAAARQKFGALADEFLKLYPADSDDEAALASNAAVRDNARISTFLWGTEWTRHATRPVYTYFWTHRAPQRGDGSRRASHSSEIDYVFGNVDPGSAGWSAEDHQIAEVMSGYWANFAATGDPNGPQTPRWPEYSPNSDAVMEAGGGFGLIPVAEPSRLDFWKRFFQTQQPW